MKVGCRDCILLLRITQLSLCQSLSRFLKVIDDTFKTDFLGSLRYLFIPVSVELPLNSAPPGYTKGYDPPGDGNCFVEALSFKMNQAKTSAQLCASTVSELLQNRPVYEMQAAPYLKGLCYLCWAKKQGQSGINFDDASISALCAVENLNISIHQRQNESTFLCTSIPSSQLSFEKFNLLLCGHGESAHFSPLSPDSSVEAEQPQKLDYPNPL